MRVARKVLKKQIRKYKMRAKSEVRGSPERCYYEGRIDALKGLLNFKAKRKD